MKIFPGKILFVSGVTLATMLIVLVGILFFFLPFIDDRPSEGKGKILTLIAYEFIAYAVAMTTWSILG